MVTQATQPASRPQKPVAHNAARGVNVRAADASGWQSRRGVVIAAGVAAMLVAVVAVLLVVRFLPGLAPSLPIERVVFVSANAQPLSEVDSDSLKRIVVAIQSRQTSMFAIDIIDLTAVIKEISWVRSATVRRQFPSSIVVAIEEHKPAGVWQKSEQAGGLATGRASAASPTSAITDNTGITLVNSYGEVFRARISDERRSQLPIVGGPDGTAAEVLATFATLVSPLQAVARHPVSLSLTPRRAWYTTLDNGSVLELGRGEIMPRLTRYIQAYPQINALQLSGARIDLRYPTGIAVANATAAPTVAR